MGSSLELTCTGCGFTGTEEHFAVDRPRCKACQAEKARVWRQGKRGDSERVQLEQRGEARCTGCATVLPLEEFGMRPGRTTRHRRCRPCRRAYQNRHRSLHIERARANQKRLRAINRDKIKVQMRERQKANAQAYADAARDYRGRKAGAFVEHVDALVVLEVDDGICGVCGGDVDPLAFHVDHIVPLIRGGKHSYANCQPAHPACNVAKRDKLLT